MIREKFTNLEKQQLLKLLSFFCCLLLQNIAVLAQKDIRQLMSEAEALEYDGLFNKALELRGEIKILCEQEEDWENAAINYCNIGYACWELKEHTLMKTHLDSALLIAQKRKLNEFGDAYATIWNYFGFYYDELGFYKRALNSYQKVFEIDEKSLQKDKAFDVEYIGSDYYNLGSILGKIGDYDNAFHYYQKALLLLESNKCQLLHIFNGIALDYQKSEKHQKAKEYYLKGLNGIFYCESYSTNWQKANIYLNISTLSNKMRQYDSLEYYLNQAIKFIKDDEELLSNYHLISGELKLQQQDFNLAQNHFQKAIQLRQKIFQGKHPSTANAYRFTAEKLYADKNQHYTAIAYYQQALEQLVIDFEYCGKSYQNPPIKNVQINDRLILLEVLSLKAKPLQAIDSQGLAQSTLQLAIDLIDDIRLNYLADGSKYILLEKAMPIYEQAVALGLEMGENTWAFEMAERSKATLLLESIQNNDAQTFAGIEAELLQKEQEQKVEIAFYERLLNEASSEKDKHSYQQVLFDLRQGYHQFLAQLEAEYPNYYQLKYNLQYPSVADIQQNILDENTALLEYFVGEEHIYLFTLQKDDLSIQKIPKSEEFEQQIQDFRSSLSTPDVSSNSFAQFGNRAFYLYDHYLKDALQNLPSNINKLLFIPDGAFNYIPFQAFIEYPIDAKKIEESRFDTLSYLTKKYAISYAYSSTLLLHMQTPKSKKKLKFGGFAPIFSGGKVVALRNTLLNELPHSQIEVNQINQYLKGEIYLRQDASLQNFRQHAHEFDILHLSTHAALDDQNPNQSRIHLYDDYITVNEIYNLPINADLTVLSACETGVGEFKRGEGLLSLARAFMYAGCPSLVTSLWQVSDEKTADLMIEFYKALADGRSKDEALQAAQLNYLNNLSSAQAAHPFYWSAFVQTGKTDPLIQNGFSMQWVLLSSMALFILSRIVIWKKVRFFGDFGNNFKPLNY